ncbi:hypothetical protein WL88_22470 [Burkholderia diffusa]|uniref:Prevent-host-death protein n=1 Tax=Burkholderia diffusa TaxID=488732 RepID=A0AAW3PB30_9BURK|nr:hypothetical protein [Burkholderia diffusa]KUZ13605.1 hypothetical protein WI28_12810 [Burkholderia diffusa]KVC11336.1 hypothetical protein WI69_25780 [Burkholderia diffusa]KVC42621.1 hypothetical protein WI71_24460 [Burkholderia diffusa]KWF36222.1 hypothetical protein WL85_14245 [Burkholderia diffusa]KWF37105.1 hypothetical protein WL86_18350 [Burkholderia diffusa]
MQNAKLPNGISIASSQPGDVSRPADEIPVDPVETAKLPVRFGVLQGQAWIADDFDAPLPEYLLDAFEGR